MVKKENVVTVKLQIVAGKAAAGPPVGTALGPHGINMGAFIKEFNERTAPMMGDKVPVTVTINKKDRSFKFEVGKPPMSLLIKKALGIASGSQKPGVDMVGKLTKEQVRSIAEFKGSELSAASVGAAMKIVAGTARSMGVEVEDLGLEEGEG